MSTKLSVLCAALLAACDGGGRTVIAIDAAITDAATFSSTDQAEAETMCYAPAVTGQVMPGASTVEQCAIWNSLSQMMGQVTIARDGAMLTMTFGSGPVVFTGTVTGDNVSLTYYTLHMFTDGCEWRATETLTGTLDPQSCLLTLSYAYAESVEVDNGACATPCSGDGTFAFDVTPIQ